MFLEVYIITGFTTDGTRTKQRQRPFVIKENQKINESSRILNSMITTDDVKEYINIKPKLSRKEALEKIHVLERQKLYATKEECKEIDKKILELGKNLVIPRRQRKLRRII